jgi:hypothetical protein
LPIDLRSISGTEQLVSLNLTANGLTHPVTRLSENELENQSNWQDLPPNYYSFRNTGILPGSAVLASIDKQRSKIFNTKDNMPLIISRKAGQQKSLAIMGYGIWRWDFMMKGVDHSNRFFKNFIGNSVRWLITREDSKLVKIESNKEIYRSGEKISFHGETYYENYRPLENAEIKVEVKGNGKEYEVLLASIGRGKYEGEFQVLEGGDYTYRGRAMLQNRHLGEDTGRFSVEEFSMEFQNTNMNEALLKQIAFKSKGEYFTPQTIAGLEKHIQFPEKKSREIRQWEIWNKLGLLIAAIALLSLEWYIRKKKGML